MEKINLSGFLERIAGETEKSPENKNNISLMTRLAEKFAADAGIPRIRSPEPDENTVVIETGHQPNFLPHPGIWKKAFLLQRLCKELEMRDVKVIGFFGFADQNLSTADLLYTTRIPALNKNGFLKIGFKIDSGERNRIFCEIRKPPRELWEQKLKVISSHYANTATFKGMPYGCMPKKPDEFLEILWSAYEKSDFFADVNAFIFSQICRDILDIEVNFFRYSDIQKQGVFLEEWKHILERIGKYNAVYNSIIQSERLDLPLVEENRAPFWYHCVCGGKVTLFADARSNLEGSCPICGQKHHISSDNRFEQLASEFGSMSLSAVTRDIVVSEGLGEDIFISGAGGSLVYGRISGKISEMLGFSFPHRMYWRSRDYYIGCSHAAALSELAKSFRISVHDIANRTSKEGISHVMSELEDDIRRATEATEQKNLIKSLNNKYNTYRNLLETVRQIFDTTPSMLDVLVNTDARHIAMRWDESIKKARILPAHDNIEMKQDIRYRSLWHPELTEDDIEKICRNIHTIEEW